MTRRARLLVVAAAVFAVSNPLVVRSDETVELVRANVQSFGGPIPEVIPQRIVATPNGYFVVDSNGHRIMQLGPDKRVVRQIGRIGQEPGALYKPAEVAVHSNGHLYVMDDVASRVQVFDQDARVVAQFQVTASVTGFAVNAKGNVLFNDPQGGSLVAEYDLRGRVVRRFGRLRRMSDFYGPEVKSMDAEHRYAVNRAHVAVDKADNIYVAFENAPAIEKYDVHGHLAFHKPIKGREADMIREGVRRTRSAPNRHSVRGDDASGPYVVNSLAVHSTTGTMFVTLQWVQNWVYVAGADGEPRGVLTGMNGPLAVRNVTLDEQRYTLIAPRNVVRPSDRVYEIEVPAQLR